MLPAWLRFGIIDGVISVMILWFIADSTDLITISNVFMLGAIYVITASVLNYMIPGRYK